MSTRGRKTDLQCHGLQAKLDDARFSAIFNNPAFALDPTDPRFSQSAGAQEVAAAVAVRRQKQRSSALIDPAAAPKDVVAPAAANGKAGKSASKKTVLKLLLNFCTLSAYLHAGCTQHRHSIEHEQLQSCIECHIRKALVGLSLAASETRREGSTRVIFIMSQACASQIQLFASCRQALCRVSTAEGHGGCVEEQGCQDAETEDSAGQAFKEG